MEALGSVQSYSSFKTNQVSKYGISPYEKDAHQPKKSGFAQGGTIPKKKPIKDKPNFSDDKVIAGEGMYQVNHQLVLKKLTREEVHG